MKNKKCIIPICIALAVAMYAATWKWFVTDGMIPIGSGLQKSDWLGFFGAFLGFVSTTFLGAVSVWQANKIYKQSLLSENKIQIYPCINQIVHLLDFTLAFFKPREFTEYSSLESAAFAQTVGAKKGFTCYFRIPYNISERMPDSIKLETLQLSIDIKDYLMEVPYDRYSNIKPIKNNLFEFDIMIGVDDSNIEFKKAILSCNDMSLDLTISAKSGDVITPIYSKYVLEKSHDESDKQDKDKEENPDKDSFDFIIKDGFIQEGTPYIQNKK